MSTNYLTKTTFKLGIYSGLQKNWTFSLFMIKNGGTLNGDYVPLNCCFPIFQVIYIKIWLMAFKWATIHYHRSRDCKTLTRQSWRSEKFALRSLFYLVKRGSNGSRVKFFLELQLWHVTYLKPLELWWQIVAHLKALCHTCLHLS